MGLHSSGNLGNRFDVPRSISEAIPFVAQSQGAPSACMWGFPGGAAYPGLGHRRLQRDVVRGRGPMRAEQYADADAEAPPLSSRVGRLIHPPFLGGSRTLKVDVSVGDISRSLCAEGVAL